MIGKKILSTVLLGIFSTSLYGACYPSSSCEQSLKEVEMDLVQRIKQSFGHIDDEIEALNKEYKNEIKELDKELYTARIRLQAEQTLYQKIANIEALLKQNVQLNDRDLTIKIIQQEIKND